MTLLKCTLARARRLKDVYRNWSSQQSFAFEKSRVIAH